MYLSLAIIMDSDLHTLTRFLYYVDIDITNSIC
jgi:hypothetical protein